MNEKKPDYYDKLKADKRNFSRSNIDQFKTFFNNHQWEEVLNCEDVQVAFDTFNDVFSTGFDQFFPLQKKRKNKFHKKQPWMTKGLLKSRNNSIKLRGIFQEFPTSTNRKVYTEYRNLFNKLKRIAKTNFYAERIDLNKGSARKTWNTLNEVLGKAKKSSQIGKILIHGEQITDEKKIASEFNKHFSNIASDIIVELPPTESSFEDYLPPAHDGNFDLFGVSVESIIETVATLENKATHDFYGLSSFILKKIISSIARPLSYIFTLSFQQGKIPHQLKISKTIPIFKSGDKNDMNNFRPIGLIPTFSKILEKIVNNRLTNYLEINNLLYKHQYGFRKHHSTLHPMIHLLMKLHWPQMVMNICLESSAIFKNVLMF